MKSDKIVSFYQVMIFLVIILIVILVILFVCWYIRISYDNSFKIRKNIKRVYEFNNLSYSHKVIKFNESVELFKKVYMININKNKDLYGNYFITHFGAGKTVDKGIFNLSVLIINKTEHGKLDIPKYRLFDWFDVLSIWQTRPIMSIKFIVILRHNFNEHFVSIFQNMLIINNKEYVVCAGRYISDKELYKIQSILSSWDIVLNNKNKNLSEGKHVSTTNHNILFIDNNVNNCSVITDIDILDSFRYPDDYSKEEQKDYCESQINKLIELANS